MARRVRRLERCQGRWCQERVTRSVAIELPGAESLPDTPGVLVGLCPRCAREVERGIAELYERLHEAIGAAVWQAERAERAEDELAVLESAHLRLLRSIGSNVADERDVRLDLGLPA